MPRAEQAHSTVLRLTRMSRDHLRTQERGMGRVCPYTSSSLVPNRWTSINSRPPTTHAM